MCENTLRSEVKSAIGVFERVLQLFTLFIELHRTNQQLVPKRNLVSNFVAQLFFNLGNKITSCAIVPNYLAGTTSHMVVSLYLYLPFLPSSAKPFCCESDFCIGSFVGP